MNKIILSIAAFLTLSLTVKAQDEAIFNHYIINPMIINPAYAGFEGDKIQLFGHYRSQWAGNSAGNFNFNPTTYNVTASLPINEKVGLGGMLISDKVGVTNRLRGQLNYAYRISTKKYKVGFGFSTEIHSLSLNNAVFDDPLTNPNDPTVLARAKGETIFDASVGIAGLIDNKFLFSVSAPNLIRARNVGSATPTTGTTQSTFFKQYILMAGYRFQTGQIKFEPSLSVRKVLETPFYVEGNIKMSALEDKLIAAITARPGKTGQFGLMLGTKFDKVQLMYSFQYSTSELSSYSGSSHEVTFGIEFEKGNKKITRGKRYRN
jgi:type IX secretion system PorP/SprF family membrane protein